MKREKKDRSHHTKKSTKSDKKSLNKRRFFSSKYIPKNRKGVTKTIIVVAIIVAIAGAIPFPYAFTKSSTVDFTTENQKDAGLELGDSKVIQEGRSGSKIVNVDSFQSIWGKLLGLEPIMQKEVSATIKDEPVSKIVADGTKKYQYMMCSDGSSRYYTDEQFKDPNTGFTSKSDDYCKKNGQGKMVQLADTSTGNVTTPSDRAPTVTVRNGCTYTSIPYKTVYRDVSWLNKGETRVSKGSDGTKSSCGWSTNPIDEEVLRGTSDPSPGFNPPANTGGQDYGAYERCLSSYNSAISQIQASESQGMGGTAELRRQVETEFSRCKRAAGY